MRLQQHSLTGTFFWRVSLSDFLQNGKTYHSKTEADLANVLIIKTVPLAIAERFDTGIVVATCSTPRMDHDREQLKGQQALGINRKLFFR